MCVFVRVLMTQSPMCTRMKTLLKLLKKRESAAFESYQSSTHRVLLMFVATVCNYVKEVMHYFNYYVDEFICSDWHFCICCLHTFRDCRQEHLLELYSLNAVYFYATVG